MTGIQTVIKAQLFWHFHIPDLSQEPGTLDPQSPVHLICVTTIVLGNRAQVHQKRWSRACTQACSDFPTPSLQKDVVSVKCALK